ncbi:beta-galactosidase/beta-glucuronidase [Haloferula luteola]|uniref:Beta-galactosidase/beta-glucuronidase n=1 Tax=Haloferula luteola TaxID=595692 RepID=A0A840VD30_9BACT|nr:glycoside hydrolase family 2 TIM barrel-domain containing protein [Haloferula luteola]MBB5350761.1 beta-galactosidase/beta-glucuronidase [Haloferula luteola]
MKPFLCWFLLLASVAFGLPRETLFTDDWKFHLGDLAGAETPEFADQQWRPVTLPHDWSIEGEFSPDHASATGFLPGGIGWYRKSFTLSPEAHGKRVLLRFEGVYRNSTVWINGQLLGHRPHGYIDFEYDLTEALVAGGTNVIAVKVERANIADSRWYPGTGIYRDVWLTIVDPIHIVRHGVFLTTPHVTEAFAEVNSTCEVTNTSTESRTLTVSAEIHDSPQGNPQSLSRATTTRTLAAGETWAFPLYHPIEHPHLWSPSDPYLYQVTHRIEVDGKQVDEVTTPLGIRAFHFDADHGFFLNGKPLLIQGVCNHHDAGFLGAAVPRAVLERRMRLLKNIGVNAFRCSHNPMQDDLYEICDELGFLVMDEAFDEWEIGKRKWVQGRNAGTAERFGYSEDFAEWAVRDTEAMVRRARQHPCVILYSIGNEIDYPTDPYVHPKSRQVEIFKDSPGQPSMTRLAAVAPSLIAAVKRHDPTRPVTMALSNASAANAIGLANMLDVAGYNYQEAAYPDDHAAFPDRILIGSENGDSPEAWAAVRDLPYISGQFLWTGFDFLGEANEWPNHGSEAGIFDIAGFPKRDALWREALWSEKPVLHLSVSQGRRGWRESDWNEPRRPNEPVQVLALTNLPKITLSLNGRSIGTSSPQNGIARWELPWEKGELIATGTDPQGQVHRATLATTGRATALKLHAERLELRGDQRDALHIIVELLDDAGRRVARDDRDVKVTVTGPLKLAALENGDQNDPTSPRSDHRTTRRGRALIILQGRAPGTATLTVEADGLPPANLPIELK